MKGKKQTFNWNKIIILQYRTIYRISQNKGKESENSYQKLKRSQQTGTRKHTETKSKYFDAHCRLSQSKECECM